MTTGTEATATAKAKATATAPTFRNSGEGWGTLKNKYKDETQNTN
jgi:hypothetical protein